MLKRSDLTIAKNQYGAWVITALVNGYYKTEQYYYYTKSEATRLFLTAANTQN